MLTTPRRPQAGERGTSRRVGCLACRTSCGGCGCHDSGLRGSGLHDDGLPGGALVAAITVLLAAPATRLTRMSMLFQLPAVQRAALLTERAAYTAWQCALSTWAADRPGDRVAFSLAATKAVKSAGCLELESCDHDDTAFNYLLCSRLRHFHHRATTAEQSSTTQRECAAAANTPRQ
jgi:hypothetical protein